MEKPELSKFSWVKNFDNNSGHDKNEWDNIEIEEKE